MNKFLYLIAFLPSMLLVQILKAQSQPVVTKTFNGSVNGAVCPQIGIEYEVSVPNEFSACTINWSATNGTATKNPNNQRKATVVWTDTPGASGTVTATFTVCGAANEANNGTSKNLTELILSIKNQGWGTFTNSYSANFCNPVPIPITMPEMVVMGTGGFNQPNRTEVTYVWKLPPGWKDLVTENTGEFGTTTRSITIVPTACAEPGIITVKGTLIGSGPFCNSAAFSSVANISINSSPPIVTVVPQSGYAGSTACNITPVTFTAVVTNAPGCTISGYQWILPANSSWSLVTQTGNTASLRPSGSPADKAGIKVKVTFGCGSFREGTITPEFNAPVISGSTPVCTSTTYTVGNAQGLQIGWTSSNTAIATINSSGVVSRVGNASGAVTVNATLPCPEPVNPKNIWIGIPNQPGSIAGEINPSVGSIYNYVSDYAAAGAAYHDWLMPYYGNPVWQQLGGNINGIINTLTPNFIAGSSPGNLQVFGVNACGNGGVRRLRVSPVSGGGGGQQQRIQTYPNPAQDELLIFDATLLEDESITLQEDVDFSVVLINSDNKEVRKGGSLKGKILLDLRDLPAGFYYLKIQKPEELMTKRIQIKR